MAADLWTCARFGGIGEGSLARSRVTPRWKKRGDRPHRTIGWPWVNAAGPISTRPLASLAPSSSRTDRRSATRRCERLADWSVRSQDLGTAHCATMSALSHASFVPDLMVMGGAIPDLALAPMRATFHEALLYSPGGRIGGGPDEILKHIVAERVLGLPPASASARTRRSRTCRRVGTPRRAS
jgi:hypothetical protein